MNDAADSANTSLEGVDYPGGIYRDQAPIHLRYICALNGIPAPDTSIPFTYCEIGCGIGETTAFLAACHPQASFYGIDLSQSHIDKANDLARASGLSNVQFVAADVATIDKRSLPEFDYVTLHGLYSWVPAHVQAAIRTFLDTKLKAGGVAYLSYNTMPGWGSVSPMRRFFIDRAEQMHGDPLAKAKKIVADLIRLRELEAPFFRDNPVAARILSQLSHADLRYVAHEYLSASWQPLYFTEVFEQLTAMGFAYVGEAGVVESLLEHSVAPPFAELLRREPDICRREALRDFVQNRFFRRDVYTKPNPEGPPAPSEEYLLNTLLGLIADPIQIPDTINIPDAPQIKLHGAWFERIKRLLGYRVMTVAEILEDPDIARCNAAELLEGLKLMSVSGFLTPCTTRETEPPRGPSECVQVVPQFNRYRLEQHDWAKGGMVLASPVLGAGVTLNSLETLLLLSVRELDPLAIAWSRLRHEGVDIQSNSDKKPITDESEAKIALQDALDQFLRYKLPKLAYLGVVVPA